MAWEGAAAGKLGFRDNLGLEGSLDSGIKCPQQPTGWPWRGWELLQVSLASGIILV